MEETILENPPNGATSPPIQSHSVDLENFPRLQSHFRAFQAGPALALCVSELASSLKPFIQETCL